MLPQKQNEMKSLQKYHLDLFVLANHSWAWGLPYHVVGILSETPLEKTGIFFLCQSVLIADNFWLGVGPHVYSLYQCWNPIWLEPVQVFFYIIVLLFSLG